MSPELEAQIAEQQPLFGPLTIEPEGVAFTRDEPAGVPVEWTEPDGGASDSGLVLPYLHGGGYSPDRVAVAGDSAGGALTVSLCADARDHDHP